MKNFLYRSLFCLNAALCFVSLPTYAANVRVGVSLPTQRDVGWVRYREALETVAKKQGNVTLLMQVADQDANSQASQVENLIAKQIDVLILAPQDAAAASSLVDAAHKAGVKVVSFDRLVLNAPVDLYVSFDNVKVGELQGQYLTKKVPKGNYIILSGAPTDNNAKLFKQGAMKFIQPLVAKGEVKIVMDQAINDWQPSEAQRLVENSLTANANKIDAVLAPNDNTAGGVIQALSSQKLDGRVAVTGQDAELTAAQRILAGTQAMTVFKDQKKLAAEALKNAVLLANKQPIAATTKTSNGKADIPSILLTPIAVDKKNLDKELVDSAYLERARVYQGRK